MELEQFFKHCEAGERWFNNGSQRNRRVEYVSGLMTAYRKNGGKTVTVIFTEDFAKWAKGVGKIEKKENDTNGTQTTI